MISRTEVEALIAELKQASQAYYQDSVDSGLTDDEYDAKAEYASTLVDSYPDLFAEGTDGYAIIENEVAAGTTVDPAADIITHDVPMLSLGKAKTEDEVLAFVKRVRSAGATDFILQAKLDGFAVSAKYKDGKVTQLATRGDSVIGEDASHMLTSPGLTIAGLPREIENKGAVEIRGELFFTNNQFENANKERIAYGEPAFKNSRNAASGLQNRAKGGIPFAVEFTFSAYSVLVDNEYADLSVLDNNVETVVHLTETQTNTKLTGFEDDADLFKGIESFGEARKAFTIPTDGVVIKPTNEAALQKAMGSTSHHPVSQMAFKYPSVKRETVVTAIDLTVGKTGRVTPIARVEPVDLEGWEVSNASIHNFNWAHEKDIRVGSVVLVTRMNDVIPQVATVISHRENAPKLEVPTNCPVCDSTLVKSGDTNPPRLIQCMNYDCSSRSLFALKTAVGRDYLDIDGLSGVLLTHLSETNRVVTIADLFTLTVDGIKDEPLGVTEKGNPRKLGETRAKKIINRIELAKTKPLRKLLASLGVESMGLTASKALVKNFKNLEAIRTATEEDIASIEMFGEVRAKRIAEGLKRVSPVIDSMIERGVEFNDPEEKTGNALAGQSFAISGPVPEGYGNRQSFVEFLESEGASFHSSPKAETTYMIADEDGTSSKVKKAKSFGVEFINATDFDTLLK